MKKRIALWILAVMLLSMLMGCGQKAPAQEVQVAVEPTQAQEAPSQEVLDEPPVVGAEEYQPQIIVMAPGAEVEIPEESVPLASSYAPESNEITKREAEAIAISYAGFENNEISFLYTKYCSENGITYYQVEFRQAGDPYTIRVDAVSGEILP